MTKQEEIREGLAKIEGSYIVADALLTYLDAQGVVIKVDCRNCQDGYVIFRTNKSRCPVCKGKGYVAVEPLKEGI